MNYIRREDYDTDAAPGICAGLSHTVSPDGNTHTFKLHFTDQQTQKQNNLPTQMNPSADRFVNLINQQAFVQYGREGFNYFQNWMVN